MCGVWWKKNVHVTSADSALGDSYLWHVVDQQQRDGDGGDVMCAADLQDVSQAHYGRVPGRDIPWTHIVIHTKVEDNMDLWQVGVPGDVKLTLKETQQVQCVILRKQYSLYVWSNKNTH